MGLSSVVATGDRAAFGLLAHAAMRMDLVCLSCCMLNVLMAAIALTLHEPAIGDARSQPGHACWSGAFWRSP